MNPVQVARRVYVPKFGDEPVNVTREVKRLTFHKWSTKGGGFASNMREARHQVAMQHGADCAIVFHTDGSIGVERY